MAEGEVRIKELEEVTTLTQNHYFVVDDSSSGGETKKYQADKVTAPLHNALLNEASSYDTTHTYNEGDYCLKDNVLYRCLYDNVTGTWTASKWVQTSLGADLTENTNDTQQAFVEGTASGTIATFTDGSNLPLKSLTADITAMQDLHGYDAPWVGGAGKNKLNLEFSNDTSSFSNLTFSHTDSTFKLKGTVSGPSYYIFNLTLPPNVDLSTDYTLSATVTGTVERCFVSVYFKNGNTDVENIRVDISDTTPKDTKQVSAQFDNAIFVIEGLQSGSYFDCEVKIQLEKGSSATTFQPYSNICPISGWDEANVSVCGTNVWDEEWELGYLDGANGQPTVESTSIRSKNFNRCVPNTNYYGKFNGTAGQALYLYWYDANKNFVARTNANNTVLTSPSNASYFKIACYHYGATYNHDISINYPSTDTEYHAYNGHTYSLTFTDGSNPLTVYGGSLDVVSGVLKVIYGIKVYSGNSNEGWYADGTQSGSTYRMKASDVPSNIKLPSSNADAMSAISNQFIATSADDIFLGNEGIGIPTNGSYLTLYSSFYNTNDVSLWKTHLASNPMQVVYELATPLTYQLSKQQIRSLVGVNNIFADTGDILDATYVRNANITINDLIRRIEALES